MPSALLAWTQSPDDPTLAGDVVSYQIASGPGPNPTAILGTVPATAAEDDTDWTVDLAAGTHFFRVRAVNSFGRRSLWSNEVSATLSNPELRHVLRISGGVRPRIEIVAGKAIQTLRLVQMG